MKPLTLDSPGTKVLDRLLDLLMVAVLLGAPLIFYTRGNDVFESNKIMALRVLACLAAPLLAFRLLAVRPLIFVRSPLDLPMLAFMACALVSTFHTANFNLSLHGVYEDFEGLPTVLLYGFFWFWIQQRVQSQRQANLFLGAVILSGTLSGFYGMLQNFGIDFVAWNPTTYSQDRLFSTLGNPNFLAAYLIMSLPITFMAFLDLPERIATDRFFCGALVLFSVLASLGLILLLHIDYFDFRPASYNASGMLGMLLSQKFLAAHLIVFFPLVAAVLLFFGRLKLILLLSMGFQVITIFFTKSRGGTLALGLMLALVAVFFLWEWRRGSQVLKRNARWVGAFAAFIVLAHLYRPIREATLETLTRLWALADFKHMVLTPRLYIWRSALQVLRDHFWFGTGLDTFQITFPKYRTALYWALEWNGTPEKAHNVVLQTAATMGFAGLLALAWILVSFTACTLRSLRREHEPSRRMLTFGVFAAVAAFFVQDLFNFTLVGYGTLFWMSLAFIPALERLSRGATEKALAAQAPAPTKPVSPLIWLALIPLCLGLALYARNSVREWVADSFYKQGQIGMQPSINRWDYSIIAYQKAVGRLGLLTQEQMQACFEPRTGTVKVAVEPGLDPRQELYWVRLGIAFEAAAQAQTKPEDKERAFLAALAVHQHTLEMNPINGYNYNNKGRVLRYAGESLHRRDLLENATRHYARAIELDPNNVYFNVDQANTFLDLDDFAQALKIAEFLTKAYPNFAQGFSISAFAKQGLGRRDEALADLELAVAKDWKNEPIAEALAWQRLAGFYSEQGKKAESAAALARAGRVLPELGRLPGFPGSSGAK